MEKIYTIREVADRLRKHIKTIQRWDRVGLLKANRTATNMRYYTQSQLERFMSIAPAEEDRRVVAYCRVSSQSQKVDLKNQRKVLEEFCIARGLANVEYVEEIGGGLNFKRKDFLEIVDRVLMGEVKTLIVAHRDRLARFGFELIEYLCKTHECELLVINSEKLSPEAEMVQDLMTIVHCFSSRLYGLRNYRKSIREALKQG